MSAPVTQLPEVEVTATPLTASTGLVLRIEGTDYGGWLTVRVRRDIETGAAIFACEVSERWPGRAQPWRIKPQSAVTVLLDGQVVITGFVDVVAPSFDGRQHRVEIRGRSMTADAVDTSVTLDGGQLKGLTVQQIAERVLKPLGITVKYDAPAGDKLADVQVQQGESPYAFVERLCRMSGVLVSDDAAGHLVFTRAGSRRAAGKLVQGQNILAASAELDWTDRFRKITVKATKPNLDDAKDWSPDDAGNGGTRAGTDGDGEDGDDGEPDSGSNVGGPGDTGVAPSGSAEDKGVTRNRELVIYGDHVMDPKQAAMRAAYEVRRRIGSSQRAKVTVQGWRQEGGALWETGVMVPIESEWLGVDRTLFIAAVEFIKDDAGTRTDLDLTLPDAYLPTAQEANKAEKTASGKDPDTKENFWKSATQHAPGD